METDVLDDRISDVLWMVAALFVFRMGWRVWAVTPPQSLGGVLAVALIYVTALGVAAAALSGVTEQYSRVLAVWTTAVVVYGAAYTLVVFPADFGTDALLFSWYSADLLVDGVNPFAESMRPALETYNVSRSHITPTTTGSTVASLSYPAGSVLPYAALRAAGAGVRSAGALAAVALGTAVVAVSTVVDSRVAALPLVGALAQRNLFLASSGGIFDALWIAPLVLCAVAWHVDRPRTAGALYGVAATVKPQPWIIGPFLLYWAYRRWGRRTAATWVGTALTAFTAVNAPFIAWNPYAWVTSVLTPVGGSAPLVQQGVGLVNISVSGVLPLPKLWFIGAVAAGTVTSLYTYHRLYPRTQWVAWMMPAVILWFYYRSLNSYFVFTAFVASAALSLAVTDPAYVTYRARQLRNAAARQLNTVTHRLYTERVEAVLRDTGVHAAVYPVYARVLHYVDAGATHTVTVADTDIDVVTEHASETVSVRHTVQKEHGMLEDIAGTVTADDVVLDVGANIGVFSLTAAAAGADAVIAAEPHPATAQRCRDNAELNTVADRVTVEAVALSDTDCGTADLRVVRDDVGTQTPTLDGVDGPAADASTTIQVPCRTADTVLDDHAVTPTVVKIDVEGAEVTVLRGMTGTLDSARAVFAEIHGNADDITAVLRDHGFNTEHVKRRGQNYIRGTRGDGGGDES